MSSSGSWCVMWVMVCPSVDHGVSSCGSWRVLVWVMACPCVGHGVSLCGSWRVLV